MFIVVLSNADEAATASDMELKVWVEGIQRIVCGVTEKTTCQVGRTRIIMKLTAAKPASLTEVVVYLQRGKTEAIHLSKA